MKLKKILICAGSIIIVLFLGMFICYKSEVLGFNTKINGVNVSMMTSSSARSKVDNSIKNRVVTLSDKFKMKTSEFCQESLTGEISGNSSFIGFLFGKNIEVESDKTIDTAKETQYLKTLLNSNATKSENAYIYKDTATSTLKIQKEVYGNEYNVKSVVELLGSSFENSSVDIESCKKTPKVTEKSLANKFDKLNKMAAWTVTYEDGVSTKAEAAYNAITCTQGGISVDYTFITKVVNREAAKENTVGITRKFKSHSDKTISVTGGSYGWLVDNAKEISQLKKKFNNGEVVSGREPKYIQIAHSKIHGANDIGDTYIEVDLGHQHLWYYKEGNIIMESDIVSGTKGEHDSPTGTFYISERKNGKYLTGDDYKTWVNKWMRLTNTGVGLHDASWRRTFGGKIYTYSGSHGCINLPAAFAAKLYDATEYGLCVIVHA